MCVCHKDMHNFILIHIQSFVMNLFLYSLWTNNISTSEVLCKDCTVISDSMYGEIMWNKNRYGTVPGVLVDWKTQKTQKISRACMRYVRKSQRMTLEALSESMGQ